MAICRDQKHETPDLDTHPFPTLHRIKNTEAGLVTWPKLHVMLPLINRTKKAAKFSNSIAQKKQRVQELTGPWERCRATGKGRTVALGGGVGATVLVSGMSETPFSTMLPMSIEALSSSIRGMLVPIILWRGGIFWLPDPLLLRLSMAAFLPRPLCCSWVILMSSSSPNQALAHSCQRQRWFERMGESRALYLWRQDVRRVIGLSGSRRFLCLTLLGSKI